MSFVNFDFNGFLRQRAVLFISPLLLIALWAWACKAGIFPPQILVSPQRVYETGISLWKSGELWGQLHHSLYRLFWGFAIGTILGLLFGIAVGLFKWVENFCSPFFNAMRQIPVITFVPMLVLIFGVDEVFKIVLVAEAGFFPVALATYKAIQDIPRSYYEVARVYRLPTTQFVTRVALPATVPPVLTGVRLSLGRSWAVLVAAELLAADSGIGQMMEMGRQMFRLDIVMVGALIAGIIGYALDRGCRSLEWFLVRWKHQ